MSSEPLTDRLEQALLDIDRIRVAALLHEAHQASVEGQSNATDDAVGAALSRIGDGWEAGTVSLSQVFMAGRILDAVMTRQLAGEPRHVHGPRISVATLGDRHTLGKTLVKGALRSAGFAVTDLGAGLSPEGVVEAAVAAHAELLMVSVLMLHSALQLRQVRDLLDTLPSRVPLAVGGAPFVHDPELWRRVGADAYGTSTAAAIRIARTQEEASR